MKQFGSKQSSKDNHPLVQQKFQDFKGGWKSTEAEGKNYDNLNKINKNQRENN